MQNGDPRKRRKRDRRPIKKRMNENFPYLREMNMKIHKVQMNLNRFKPERATQTHYNFISKTQTQRILKTAKKSHSSHIRKYI